MGVCHTGERHLSLLLRQEKNVNVINEIAWSTQHLFSLISVMEPQISDMREMSTKGALTLQQVTQADQSESFFRQCNGCWETDIGTPLNKGHKFQCCCFGLPTAILPHTQRSLS